MAVTKGNLFTPLRDATKAWLPTRGEPIVYHALSETRASQQDPRLAPPPVLCRSSYENCRVCTNNSHSAASALIPFPSFDFQPSTFDIFRKLSFQHSRTYLQEPALRRSGASSHVRP